MAFNSFFDGSRGGGSNAFPFIEVDMCLFDKFDVDYSSIFLYGENSRFFIIPVMSIVDNPAQLKKEISDALSSEHSEYLISKLLNDSDEYKTFPEKPCSEELSYEKLVVSLIVTDVDIKESSIFNLQHLSYGSFYFRVNSWNYHLDKHIQVEIDAGCVFTPNDSSGLSSFLLPFFMGFYLGQLVVGYVRQNRGTPGVIECCTRSNVLGFDQLFRPMSSGYNKAIDSLCDQDISFKFLLGYSNIEANLFLGRFL